MTHQFKLRLILFILVPSFIIFWPKLQSCRRNKIKIIVLSILLVKMVSRGKLALTISFEKISKIAKNCSANFQQFIIRRFTC